MAKSDENVAYLHISSKKATSGENVACLSISKYKWLNLKKM